MTAAQVRPCPIVPIQVLGDAGLGLKDGVVRMQIDLFVLHRAPQPFDEHIVTPGTAAIHAHLTAPVFNQIGELGRRELATLVGIDDVRRAVASERVSQHLDRVTGFQVTATRCANALRLAQSMTAVR